MAVSAGCKNRIAVADCTVGIALGIIIDKQGAMLTKLGALAREDMEDFLGTKVNLQTWVKVKESWRDSLAQLRNFGYTE